MWDDPAKLRKHIEELVARHPELFPPAISGGFHLTGKLPESKKLPGIRLRQLRLKAGGPVYTLRPSFVLPYMTGRLTPNADSEHPPGAPAAASQRSNSGRTADIENGLLLLSYNVPIFLVSNVCGGGDMFWERLLQRLGRNSLVGTTVRDPQRLPQHLAADEHHLPWCHEQGYAATTVGSDCILGLALTSMADDAHLQQAYGVFQQEARNVDPDYSPRTVNTDGWAATKKAFRTLFQTVAVILCFLHGFLKIRDRCRKSHDLHQRVWEVYRADTAAEFQTRMQNLWDWCGQTRQPPPVMATVQKLYNRAEEYAVSYAHSGCHRTSNAVDRPMNALYRHVYAGRGLHGHQNSSELRLRGWALLYNFRPYARRGRLRRDHASRAHKLNARRYSNNWVENLLISASRGGRKEHT